ncbi:hypothetical protein GCM10011575_08440 [Microlunatus endophyticus]|uniref:Uncharacterized protein n=1 Tax=Microlunatus endophyticus TaxID=1716077 RepID=A0A917S2N6_9ACTN|nr:hypothetical protein GCM10011575_08440 [Microlunatus endophyticus]
MLGQRGDQRVGGGPPLCAGATLAQHLGRIQQVHHVDVEALEQSAEELEIDIAVILADDLVDITGHRGWWTVADNDTEPVRVMRRDAHAKTI